MKTYFLLCTAIFFNAHGQTLTQAFNEPVVGDVDKNYRLDTSAFTNGLPVNVSGNNCVWNYQALTGAFPVIVDSFLVPSAAAGSTAFPNATFVQHRDLLNTFYHSSTSPQQTELLGAYSPSLSLTFTNTAIIANYPVSYGYNLLDPVSGSFKYNSTNGACNGHISISAPGTGTLILPNNNPIPGVLCLKSVEVLTLSVGAFPVGTFSQTIYNYYMPGRKFPVLNMNYTTSQLLAGTPTVTAYMYGSNSYFTVAGIRTDQFSEKFKTYPNPFHEILYVTGNAREEREYLFFDLDGRLVLHSATLSEAGLAKLRPGIFILEIRDKKNSQFQKVIRE
jgi:hypothetical protein